MCTSENTVNQKFMPLRKPARSHCPKTTPCCIGKLGAGTKRRPRRGEDGESGVAFGRDAQREHPRGGGKASRPREHCTPQGGAGASAERHIFCEGQKRKQWGRIKR